MGAASGVDDNEDVVDALEEEIDLKDDSMTVGDGIVDSEVEADGEEEEAAKVAR